MWVNGLVNRLAAGGRVQLRKVQVVGLACSPASVADLRINGMSK
jgi:hypothetical protein